MAFWRHALYLVFAASALAVLRNGIRGTLFVPDPLPPVAVKTYAASEVAPGMTMSASAMRQYGRRIRVTCTSQRRKPAGKMPGLVVVNGHGDDKYSPYTFYASVLYTRAGAVSLTYDPTGEGERNGDRKGGAWQHDRNLEPEDFGRRMGGLMLAKIIQATSYLPQRSHVDSKRSRPWAIRRAVSCSALPVTVETQLHAYVLAGAAIWMENVPRDSLINRSGF